MTQPSKIICPGEPLTLTCRETNGTEIEVLRWNIHLPSGNTTLIERNIPIVGNRPPRSFIHPTTQGITVFNFSRTSDENIHPLVTELLISGVSVGINGTEISCSKADLSDRHNTTIYVINGKYYTILLSNEIDR